MMLSVEEKLVIYARLKNSEIIKFAETEFNTERQTFIVLDQFRDHYCVSYYSYFPQRGGNGMIRSQFVKGGGNYHATYESALSHFNEIVKSKALSGNCFGCDVYSPLAYEGNCAHCVAKTIREKVMEETN